MHRQQKRGVLLSFPKRTETLVQRDRKCDDCDKLESECQYAIDKISSVVETRFLTFSEKLQALHQWQDIRDAAIRALYEHEEFHARRVV